MLPASLLQATADGIERNVPVAFWIRVAKGKGRFAGHMSIDTFRTFILCGVVVARPTILKVGGRRNVACALPNVVMSLLPLHHL